MSAVRSGLNPGTCLLTLACLWVLLGMVACNPFSLTLKVDETNFSEEISPLQNLVFTFNRHIAPDDRLNLWDTTAFLAFEPHVPGRFKWIADNQLVFSPAAGFRASTEYLASPTMALAVFGKHGYKPDTSQEIHFHTPFIRLESYDPYWSSDGSRLEARAHLMFNYTVDPAVFRQYAHCYLDGKEVSYQLETREPSERLTLVVAGVAKNHQSALELRLEIKPGFRCVASPWTTEESQSLEMFFPSPGLLQINEVFTEHTGAEGLVRIICSQPLKAQAFRSKIRITWQEDDYDPQTTRTFEDYEIERYENSLELRGNFDYGQTYQLEIQSGLQGLISNLEDAYSRTLIFEKIPEGIAFAQDRGRYLSAAGLRNLGLRINEIPEIQVKVAKVYANNLLPFFRQDQQWGYHWEEAQETYHNYEYYDLAYFGDVVYERTMATANLTRSNGLHLLPLDFEDRRSSYNGIYVVEVQSKDKFWLRASKIVSISDIGLMARAGRKDLTVFVHSLKTAQPREGVRINLISSNNQTVQSGRSDADGVVVFRDLPATSPDFEMAMVTAEDGSDFNYLHFEQSGIETSRFEVGGKNTRNRQYDAFIYGDRDLYRPGEELHLNAIVRTFDWEPTEGMPVYYSILFPNGKPFKTIRGKLNEQGAFSASVSLPADIITGTYQVDLYSGSNRLLRSRSVSIEEFMPDRISVHLNLNQSRFQAGETLQTRIRANNFFGPPAARRNYELELQLQRKPFRPKGYEHFTFDLTGDRTFQPVIRTGKTDDEGRATEAIDLGQLYRNRGMLEGRVYATVFDETGRPVSRLETFELATQSVFVGIRQPERYLSSRQAIRLPLAAVNRAGQSVPNTFVKVRIIKHEWETVLERVYGRLRYKSRRREKLLKVEELQAGRDEVVFRPPYGGKYEIRVFQPGSERYTAVEFHAFGWQTNSSSAWEVDTDGNISITADQTQYQPGASAKLLFKTPFDGQLLITLEQDEVLSYQTLETRNRTAELEIDLDETHLPNVYVNATLIRSADSSRTPFTVAHGILGLKVDAPEKKLEVRIEAPRKSRSHRRQTITVHTSPGAEVTVAAVDEGILQIRDTPTPDPYGYFYGKRALEVEGYDLYPLLLPELGGEHRTLSTGGGNGRMGRRVNPMSNRRVQLMAKWSGPRRANSRGIVQFTFNIPQFSGKLRLMAAAYDGDRFGHAEKAMTVADPLVVSAALPRFLSPGDTVEMPVTLTNTTEKNLNGPARIKVTGPLEVLQAETGTIDIPARNETLVLYTLRAEQELGKGSVTLSIQAGGETFTNKTEITVRPAASLQYATGSGSLAGGESHTVNLAAIRNRYLSPESRLIVSRSPVAALGRELRGLVRYPYGCLEQTISSAFPQIYFADLAATFQPDSKGQQEAARHVQAAIDKIQSMQLYDGGMAYWPGADKAHPWGSVFAAHFLIEADRAGFAVSPQVVENLLSYVGRISRGKERRMYSYQGGYREEYIAREIPYALFVLTLAGEKPLATLNFYKSRLNLLAPDSRALLASSYAQLGAHRQFDQLSQHLATPRPAERELGGSFSSAIRNKALQLYALLTADPNHDGIPALARDLNAQIRQTDWLNTQEKVFSFLAIGKLAQQSRNSTVTGDVLADGKPLGRVGEQPLTLNSLLRAEQITLKTAGQGQLYWYWEVSGIRRDGQVEEMDDILKVRRAFYDRNGNVIQGRQFTQNDLIVVRIDLTSQSREQIDNIVVTDLLPAGFEIENPRISAIPDLEWVGTSTRPEHLDIRDDRIHFFTSLNQHPQTFYYVVRAISPGTYHQGPVSAEAMYNAEYRSVHGGGRVHIRKYRDVM